MALPDPTQLPWPHLMMCYRISLSQLEEAIRAGQTARAASLRPHVKFAAAARRTSGGGVIPAQPALLGLYADVCEREAQRLEQQEKGASRVSNVATNRSNLTPPRTPPSAHTMTSPALMTAPALLAAR